MQIAGNEAGLCPRGNCYISNKDIKIKSEVWSTRITHLDQANAADTSSAAHKPGPSSSSSNPPNLSNTSNPVNNTNNIDKYSSKSDGKKVPKWFKGTGKSYK